MTVQSRATCAAAPCKSCPYRRDVPSGLWHPAEYAKLRTYDGETGEQAFAPFYCHRNDGKLCAGWLATHDPGHLLALRFLSMRDAVDPAVFAYVSPVPVFGSGAEACEHGLAEVGKPGTRARRMIAGLLRAAARARPKARTDERTHERTDARSNERTNEGTHVSTTVDLFADAPGASLLAPIARTITRTAILSDEPVPLYRLRLERFLNRPGRTAALIGVNPSTADAAIDDQTIRKLYGFGDRLDIARWIVGNKFAFRATDVRELRELSLAAAVGIENDRHIEQIMRDADLHIVAWGPLSKLPPHLRSRWRDVVEIARRVGCPLHALALAQCGQPRHPQMLGYVHRPSPWSPPQ